MPEVDDVENEDLNVLEIVVSHRVDEHIEDDTLCRTDVDPTIVERPIVRHVTDDFIDNVDEHLSHASGTSTMSFPRTNFLETDAMSLEFADDLDNLAGGSSSVGDNSVVFVLDFIDQALNRFVEHKMLTTFKEFQGDCHRHVKKYSDPKEARANPPHLLVGRDED
ncbi:gamma-aminobutyrate transaminase POP2 [Cucumis melo var. makuwa]|uniref:Gamma-aminobutyrate transaminase POP2 n=1 Tax=Cucumis melo var. makuwa TaxID=1194695 RepID=A0A5D3D1G9_CUCMM|nr:gamma-aminobutyrate transaminase POP2 [Cucumis melo var. makuwa]